MRLRVCDSADRGRNPSEPLRFSQTVLCPVCLSEFAGEFVAGADGVEGLAAAPVGFHRCPECRFEFGSEYCGWVFLQEVG